MPTREEIVKMLRLGETLSLDGKMSDQFIAFSIKVEGMRCETCKWWRSANGFIGACAIDEMPERCDNDFGCFAHEQKPAG